MNEGICKSAGLDVSDFGNDWIAHGDWKINKHGINVGMNKGEGEEGINVPMIL